MLIGPADTNDGLPLPCDMVEGREDSIVKWERASGGSMGPAATPLNPKAYVAVHAAYRRPSAIEGPELKLPEQFHLQSRAPVVALNTSNADPPAAATIPSAYAGAP